MKLDIVKLPILYNVTLCYYGICRRLVYVSVYVCVCHTLVLYHKKLCYCRWIAWRACQ